jgi:glycosyltransferase involved in cell wall biosynthesis
VTTTHDGAVIVMPRRRAEGGSAAGLWTLAAGWAKAAERRFGSAWVVTLDGVASPDDVLGFADPGRGPTTRRAPKPRVLPMVLRTAAKDVVRAWAGHAARHVTAPTEWLDHKLAFVWQHHDLFQSPGEAIARRHRCPLVSFVDAPLVWEARRWGVARPGWGRLVERYVEQPQLRASDVVACVSDEVAREVARLGVGREQIIVSPNAVDAERFAPAGNNPAVREPHGLGDAFVVGWVGTFRRFQGLDTIIGAFGVLQQADPRARLLLVGDGAERAHVERVVDEAGVRGVVFAGAVGARAVPDLLGAMDVAVVSAREGEGFHYSPLKLREYLACGRAVVAPRLGEIPVFVDDGVHALLYEPGDAHDLAAKLRRLRDDPELRLRLGAAGRQLVVATATWDVRLAELLDSASYRAAVTRVSGT